MKRRDFLTTTAGLGAAGLLLGKATSASAKEQPAEEQRLQVYLCEICGTVAEILVPGEAPIVHCGKPMKLLEELTEGPGAEKHVPVIEKIDGGYKVKVGKTPHPMTEAHYIGFIDLVADGKVCRQFLKPGDKPEADFLTAAKNVTARAWCNLHGLWKATS